MLAWPQPIDASADVLDTDLVASAGMGAVTAQEEVAIFTQYLASCRERLGTIGINLPLLTHSTLGKI